MFKNSLGLFLTECFLEISNLWLLANFLKAMKHLFFPQKVDEENLDDVSHEQAVKVLKSTSETVKLLISRGSCKDESPLSSSPSVPGKFNT